MNYLLDISGRLFLASPIRTSNKQLINFTCESTRGPEVSSQQAPFGVECAD